MAKKHINHTITSNEGCKFHIVGDVEFTIIPPSFTNFKGTITMSGSGKCPNGKVTFGVANPNGENSGDNDTDIILHVNSYNIYQVNEINWKKNLESVPKQLESKGINAVLLEELKALEKDMLEEYEKLSAKSNKYNASKNVSVNVSVNCN